MLSDSIWQVTPRLHSSEMFFFMKSYVPFESLNRSHVSDLLQICVSAHDQRSPIKRIINNSVNRN